MPLPPKKGFTQNENGPSYNLTLTRMANTKKAKGNQHGEDVERLEPLHAVGGL